ncbi:MAG TPA: PhzF family phenazine biosynthesis protein [Jatrophihabitantaceae bacterium]
MRIRIIDAFTDRPFAGNPAGVCLLDGDAWPDEAWMRRVAAELNLSETAFAHPLADGDWALRWFTPTVETNLCGHATLATTHALHSDGRASGPIEYRTRSGSLIATPQDDGSITLDFPAAPLTEASLPDGLAEALGPGAAKAESAYRTGPLGDLLVVLPDEGAVRSVEPDFAALTRISVENDIRGVIVTAPGDPGSAHDVVSRFFTPASGILEDPVTGSAHTAVTPYWADRLGRPAFTALQASARTGILQVALHGDRVHLTGRAITVVDGELLIAP